jgi:hypothetical protein
VARLSPRLYLHHQDSPQHLITATVTRNSEKYNVILLQFFCCLLFTNSHSHQLLATSVHCYSVVCLRFLDYSPSASLAAFASVLKIIVIVIIVIGLHSSSHHSIQHVTATVAIVAVFIPHIIIKDAAKF